MASETYEFLKKVAKGEEVNRWSYPDKLIDNIRYDGRSPKVTIVFEKDEDFLKVLMVEDDDDIWVYKRFNSHYDSDYDSYRYQDDWNEGYIIEGFNEENTQKLEELLALTNPKLNTNGRDFEIARFLDKKFESEVDDLISDYGDMNWDCIFRAIQKTLRDETNNPFGKIGIVQKVHGYKFEASVKLLLTLYKIMEAEDDDLMGLLRKLYERFNGFTAGQWHELEYNSWCDDYDKEEEQSTIGKHLDKMLEIAKEELEEENSNPEEYTKLYNAVAKLGGFGKRISIPEKNIKVVFDNLSSETNKLIFRIYKYKFENYVGEEIRSVDNLEDLNVQLYHPELFESIRNILKKLL